MREGLPAAIQRWYWSDPASCRGSLPSPPAGAAPFGPCDYVPGHAEPIAPRFAQSAPQSAPQSARPARVSVNAGKTQPIRLILGLLGAAAVAALAALALGEYGFSGIAVVGSGLVVGLFVSEVAVSVSGVRSWAMTATTALLTVAGMLGAASTSTGQRLSTVPFEGWLAVGAGALAAALRARPLRTAPDSRPEPPSPE